jgi:orotidine-5'-phosphate decarboxylase
MQDIKVDGKPLFAHIAREIMTEWNYNKNILLVAGATYPQEIKMLREIVPEATFLVPGIGAQGGSIEEVIKNGARADGAGLIISSSRAIIHASNNDDFAEKALAKAQETCREISDNMKSFR